jgi:hypothetical protein
MAHFYGTINGQRGQASRLGGKASGLTTYAASWQGAVKVSLWYDSAPYSCSGCGCGEAV